MADDFDRFFDSYVDTALWSSNDESNDAGGEPMDANYSAEDIDETSYKSLKAELTAHMFKEEQILFPMLRQGQGAMAGGPISVMMSEHDNAGAALARMRSLTDGYTVPAEACNTWRALWHGLDSLEQALHEHIHLENNILFPRALKPGA